MRVQIPTYGRGWPLRLHPDQPLDHRRRREPLPLEQELARERRAVQLAQREDALGHGAKLSAAVFGPAVLLVGDVLAPVRRNALVVDFQQREVRHEAIRPGAVPVLLAGLEEDAVAGADLLHRPPRRCASPSPSVT